MRGYRRYVIIFTGIMVLLLVGMNLVFRNIENSSRGNHYYKVEIHRALQDEALQNEIVQADEQKQIICIDLTSRDIKTADSNAAYETLESLEVLPKNASELQIHDFYQIDNRPYTIIEDQGHILRFTYREVSTDSWTLYFLNITLLITAAVGYLVLFTMYMAVVRPFERIEAFPDELARGQLAGELPQTKNHLFCRFIWGLNMLRDKLEERKQKELVLQKEKQTLILSISHDIKTPLSTIKLYARALAEHLYDTDERRVDAARRIDEKANEISHSVDAIIQASTGEFLNLPVVDSEFYLERLVTKISEYYTHRLEAAHTHFSIEKYSDCLIRGDFDRMCEVTENFLENAIKYGDGKEISLSFTREEDCILMTVQNSGCTLLSEEVVHIFECFRRGSNSTNINGSGLGLYIARKLCTSMGGEVYAKVSDGIFTVTAVMKRA